MHTWPVQRAKSGGGLVVAQVRSGPLGQAWRAGQALRSSPCRGSFLFAARAEASALQLPPGPRFRPGLPPGAPLHYQLARCLFQDTVVKLCRAGAVIWGFLSCQPRRQIGQGGAGGERKNKIEKIKIKNRRKEDACCHPPQGPCSNGTTKLWGEVMAGWGGCHGSMACLGAVGL